MKKTNHWTLNTKHWFTMAELIVVITILVILSAIGFSSYSWYLGNARDSQRKSDISQIQAALGSYKLKRWYYSQPWDAFDITYWATEVVATQWVLNNNVALTTIDRLPMDPKAERPYTYSTTKNKQEFQISATLENAWREKAILVWDYKTVSKNILPSIVVATSSATNIATNTWAFVFDDQWQNLTYSIKTGWPKNNGTDIASYTSHSNFWQNSDFRTCVEIKEWGKILLENTPLEYQILNNSWSLENTTCSWSLQF